MSAPFTRVSGQRYHRGRIARAAALAGLAAAAVWAVRRWRPTRVVVAGESMAPALMPGDWAVALEARAINRGDVVVVRHPLRPGIEMVKRVTGVPGDRVGGITLRAGQWFVEGDDSGRSIDSRELGPVGREHVVARVLFVYWPPGRWGPVRSSAR